MAETLPILHNTLFSLSIIILLHQHDLKFNYTILEKSCYSIEYVFHCIPDNFKSNHEMAHVHRDKRVFYTSDILCIDDADLAYC